MADETTGSDSTARRDRAIVVIPVFNDWDSLRALLRDIDAAFGVRNETCRVTVLDDGSTMDLPDDLRGHPYTGIRVLDVIRLRMNLGHQRAIAVALARLGSTGVDADAVIVMDGDGEDRPQDIFHLLAALDRSAGRHRIVFAARTKRFEGITFRVLYHLYRVIHWVLTGHVVRVGNFSALSPSSLQRLSLDSAMWNHYAAAVVRSRIPFSLVPLARGHRYHGASHMRYSTLVAHGLSAVAVFGDVVAARLIVAFGSLAALAAGLFLVVMAVRLTTDWGIPGWATNTAGLLILFAMQLVVSLLILVLIVLGDRSQARVIPARDADLFVESIDSLWQAPS